MKDGEAMFLRKLALSVNRLDFWNLPKELTRTQLAVHRAAMSLEPTGEDRADIRSAVHAIAVMQSQKTQVMTPGDINKLMPWFTQYLPIHDVGNDVVSPDEAARMIQRIAK